jgi:hypothetical protein
MNDEMRIDHASFEGPGLDEEVGPMPMHGTLADPVGEYACRCVGSCGEEHAKPCGRNGYGKHYCYPCWSKWMEKKTRPVRERQEAATKAAEEEAR